MLYYKNRESQSKSRELEDKANTQDLRGSAMSLRPRSGAVIFHLFTSSPEKTGLHEFISESLTLSKFQTYQDSRLIRIQTPYG